MYLHPAGRPPRSSPQRRGQAVEDRNGGHRCHGRRTLRHGLGIVAGSRWSRGDYSGGIENPLRVPSRRLGSTGLAGVWLSSGDRCPAIECGRHLDSSPTTSEPGSAVDRAVRERAQAIIVALGGWPLSNRARIVQAADGFARGCELAAGSSMRGATGTGSGATADNPDRFCDLRTGREGNAAGACHPGRDGRP